VTDSANLDLVRSIYADWERGDFATVEWADPEIEITIVGGPEPGRWTGLAGMAEMGHGLFSSWEGFRYAGAECRELDVERVLGFHKFLGRGKTSGLDLGQMRTDGTAVFHIRNGRIAKLVLYWGPDRDRALADLGLAPEGDAPGLSKTIPTNTELAQQLYALWNAGGVEAMVEHVWAPDIVFHDIPEAVDGGIFRGAEEVAARHRAIVESLGHVQIEIRSVEERGDYTLATLELRMKGSSSGVAFTGPLLHVLRWTDGRSRESRHYVDADQARRDFERLSAQT
jgi:ketosteroid isomerase-like protein